MSTLLIPPPRISAIAPTILPDPTRLRLDLLRADDQHLTMLISTKGDEAHCPLWNHASTAIHSHYQRTLADLPWNGIAVRLQLTTRRFFCRTTECPRRIFTERLPGIVAPYARRTLRLTQVLEVIGFAVGGEAGARVLRHLAVRTLLLELLPLDEERRADALVGFAFLAQAAVRPKIAGVLRQSFAQLQEFVSEQIRQAQDAGDLDTDADPDQEAKALLALTDGLSIHVLAGQRGHEEALVLLDHHLNHVFSLASTLNQSLEG